MGKSITILFLLFFFWLNNAVAREIAVLLPLTGPLTPNEITELTKITTGNLQQKFDLKYGAAIDKVVKQAFREESKSNNCDETNCYRKIAAHYKAEVIIAIRAAKMEKDNLLLTLNFYNVMTNEMTNSQKRECSQCTFEKLKVMFNDLTSSVSKD